LELAPVAKIVISYRRFDSDAFAGRIRDRIAGGFGDDSVFMDVDNIPFGRDFRIHIQKALAEADAVLVVVGPKWLSGEKGRNRIKDDADPVRIEVETALGNGIPTIPILVGRTSMPMPEQLPESLKNFAFINAAPVDAGRDFHRDLSRVISAINTILAGPMNAAQASLAIGSAVAPTSGSDKFDAEQKSKQTQVEDSEPSNTTTGLKKIWRLSRLAALAGSLLGAAALGAIGLWLMNVPSVPLKVTGDAAPVTAAPEPDIAPIKSAAPVQAPAGPASIPAAAPRVQASPAVAPDEVLWTTIKDSRISQMFEEFLNKFPESAHADEARARLKELAAAQAAIKPDDHATLPKICFKFNGREECK
jgi:TIR domain